MGEVVAYEDSPMGDYLKDIDAPDALIVENSRVPLSQESSTETLNNFDAKSQRFLENISLLAEPGNYYCQLLDNLYKELIKAVSKYGYTHDTYTPLSGLSQSNSREENCVGPTFPGHTEIYRPAVYSVASLVAASGAILCGNISQRYIVLVAAFIAASIIGFIYCVWSYTRRNIAVYKVQGCIALVNNTVLKCRILDSKITKSFKLIREVGLISKGFHIPGPNPSRIPQPGRGAIYATSVLKQAIDDALHSSGAVIIDAKAMLFDKFRLVISASRADYLIEEYNIIESEFKSCHSSNDKSFQALKEKFDTHYKLRRWWLIYIIECIYSVGHDKDNSNTLGPKLYLLLDILSIFFTDIFEASCKGIDTIQDTEDARYTTNSWDRLIKANQENTTNNRHPFIRSISSVSHTIDTIQAKLIVCREQIGLEEISADRNMANETDPSELSRIFASIKADIDILNTQYHSALSSLMFSCDKSTTDNGCLDAGVGPEFKNALGTTGNWIDENDIPDEIQILECYKSTNTELDVSGMTYEANVDQDASFQKSRSASLLNREERIRIQRQKRKVEAAETTRKNDIHSIMSELKSTIDTRTHATNKN